MASGLHTEERGSLVKLVDLRGPTFQVRSLSDSGDNSNDANGQAIEVAQAPHSNVGVGESRYAFIKTADDAADYMQAREPSFLKTTELAEASFISMQFIRKHCISMIALPRKPLHMPLHRSVRVLPLPSSPPSLATLPNTAGTLTTTHAPLSLFLGVDDPTTVEEAIAWLQTYAGLSTTCSFAIGDLLLRVKTRCFGHVSECSTMMVLALEHVYKCLVRSMGSEEALVKALRAHQTATYERRG